MCNISSTCNLLPLLWTKFFFISWTFFFYLGHSLSCIDLRRTTDFLCVRILCIIFNKHMFNWIFKVPFYKTSTLFVLMAPHNNSGTEFIPPAKRNFFFFFLRILFTTVKLHKSLLSKWQQNFRDNDVYIAFQLILAIYLIITFPPYSLWTGIQYRQ